MKRATTFCALLLLSCSGTRPPPAPSTTPPFSRPSDFDRAACVPGSMQLFSPRPTGVWNVDLSLSGLPPFPVAIRVDADQALFLGVPSTLTVSPDDIFVRTSYRSGDREIVWAFDGCQAFPPREFRGSAAQCADADCILGGFRAVRLERIAGEAEAQGLALVAAVSDFPDEPEGAWTAAVRVRGDLAFLARARDGLRIVDLSPAGGPVLRGHLRPEQVDQGEYYNDVELYDHYALLASSRLGMVVVDVADPAAPRAVASFPPRAPNQTRVNVHSIAVDGDRAYLAELSIAGMRIVSLADPTKPTTIARYVHPDTEVNPDAFVHDLTVHEGRAYLNYWGAGFVVVSLDETPPRLIGRMTYPRMTSHASFVTRIGVRLYALHGDEDFEGHLRIVDVTEPTDPAWMRLVGEFFLRPETSIHNFRAVGNKAYLTHYQDGVRVLDLRDPTRPLQTAYFNTWSPDLHPGQSFYEGAIDVDVDPARRRLYVADTDRGLLVLEERP